MRPRVVLLHGHACDHEFWAPQISGLVQAGFPVAAPDFPFHGGPTEGYTPTVTSLAEYCRDLLCAGPPVVLAGHSLGGMVAQQVARMAPDLVRGIVLVDSFTSLAVSCLPSGMTPRDPEQAGWVARRRAELLEAGGPDLATALMDSIMKFDSRAWVGTLAVPMLALWGGRERFTPAEAAEVAAGMGFADVPDLEVAIIGPAGHFVCQDNPEEVSARLVDWLQRHFSP